MKKLRLLTLFIVVLSALVLVAACNRGEEDVSEAATTPAPQQTPAGHAGQDPAPPAVEGNDDGFPAFMNPVGTLPIVNESVTLSVTVSQLSGFDFDGNPITYWFEEQTGVSIDWLQVPQADWDTRLNLMLATGDLTDIIVSGVGSHATVYFYAQLGLFMPITDYLDPFAPELMNMFYHLPNIHADMIMPDGHIYGFPSIDDAFHSSLPQKLWINTAWLDALGLPMPRTTEEFYDTLVAFRDLDPNQNGRPGSVLPFAGAAGQGHSIERLLGRFVTTDEGNRLIVENGRIVPVFNTEEWREGLRFLNRMYTSGLIAPDTFVQDRSGLRAMGDHPDYNIVGVMPGLWLGQMITTDFDNQEGRWNDFRVIPYLITPDGRQENFTRPLQGNHRAAITNNLDPELMPVAVRWLDNFMTEISTLMTIQGQEDVHWRWADPGTVSIAGGPARWERIISPEGGAATNDMWAGQPMPNWRSHDWRLSERADRSIVEQETLLYDETLVMFPYRNDLNIIVPVLIFDEVQSAELVDIQAPINSFVAENIARFTVGDLCLDDDWDWYIRELEVMGLSRLLELNQNAFDLRR